MKANSGVPRYRRLAKTSGRYRSRFEKTTADQLTSKKIKFKYEESKFDYLVQGKNLIVCPNCGPLKAQIVRKYTPDFEIVKNQVFLECKGRFLQKDRSKMIAVKKQHPKLDIRMVFMRDNVMKDRADKITYMQWAKKYGFPACVKTIPDDWYLPLTKMIDWRKALGEDI